MSTKIEEQILKMVNSINSAINPNVIFERLNQDQSKNLNDFAAAVNSLRDQGKIIITKKGKIISTKSTGLICAKIISMSNGFAFAEALESNDDIFILSEKLKLAMVGDTVMLHNIKRSEKGISGEVERIISKGDRIITGTISRRHKGCELIADSAYRFPIAVDKGATLGARDKDKVKVILSCTKRRKKITARVIKIYGKADVARVCADAIIDANGIPSVFSNEIIDEAKEVSSRKISENDLKNRLDLREELIFTIDGADAKDLDDAISISITEKGFKLGVHIADVSYYVKENSLLDEEAQIRGTSVYFADRVIPMLPKEISNGICSLNANEDKLTFSAIMEVDNKGNLLSYEFKKSIINSKVRGVYSEVNDILNNSASNDILSKYNIVMDSILNAKKLSDILEKKAAIRGNMDISSRESYFKLDENGVCIDVSPRTSGPSERIIEQFMILANQSAAIYAKSSFIPFVYRVHEEPDPEKLKNLSNLVGLLGLNNKKLKVGATAKDFQNLLNESKNTASYKIISHQVLRTMSKAKYSQNPLGHFGLSLDDYCHFTSPIRRYPDTAIHRILSDLINNVDINIIQKKYQDYAIKTAKDSSFCEVRAMKAERDAEKCYMAEFMSHHIGETFSGIISGVNQKGVFVELLNSVEGFLSLEYFPKCRFVFDGITKHKDELSDFSLTIGDSINVKVISSYIPTGIIDFAPENFEM